MTMAKYGAIYLNQTMYKGKNVYVGPRSKGASYARMTDALSTALGGGGRGTSKKNTLLPLLPVAPEVRFCSPCRVGVRALGL
eukprot:SAG11_NODE_321_length_10781_cov_6.440835_3_plen_82_part_00